MTDDALHLAAELVVPIAGFQEPTQLEYAAAAALKRLHTRVQELEAQAARRAPAAPVPQGWRLVPVEPTKEMIQRACDDHGYPGGSRWVYRDGYRSMLATAPQPPEAAPVELPEPAAWMLGCQTMGGDVGWKLSWSQSGAGVCHRISGKEHEMPLYTEQQVIDLLKSVGVSAKEG